MNSFSRCQTRPKMSKRKKSNSNEECATTKGPKVKPKINHKKQDNGEILCEIKNDESGQEGPTKNGSNENYKATAANTGIKMNSFRSMESSLNSVKERCEILRKIEDQSRNSLDPDMQKSTESFQDLINMVHTYCNGLSQLLLERCYFFLLSGDYPQSCIYADQLSNLARNILFNHDLLNEAKSILSKKFIETTSEHARGSFLKKKHMTALAESTIFLEKIQNQNWLIKEHDLLQSLYATHIKLFHIQDNLDLNLECSKIACELLHEEMLLEALCNFAHLYQLLGKYQECYDILNEMLSWEIKSPRLQCRVIVNLSVVALLLGHHDKSLEYAQRSVGVAKATGNKSYTKRYTACCYGNIGLALEHKKEFQAAIEPYKECLQLGKGCDDPRIINNGYCNLGRAYQGLSEIEKAKKYYKKALETPRPPEAHWCDTEDFRFSPDYLLAMIAFEEKNWREARTYLLEVIERCEWLRKSCQHSDLKITFNDTQRKPFQYLQYVCVQEGAEADALVVAEKGRGRDFYDKTDGEKALQEHLDKPEALLDIAKKRQVAVLFLSTIEVITPNQLYMWLIFPDGTYTLKKISEEHIGWDKILNGFCVDLYMQQGRLQTEFRGVDNDNEQDQIDACIQHTLEVTKQVKGISDQPAVTVKHNSPPADSHLDFYVTEHTTNKEKTRKGGSWSANTENAKSQTKLKMGPSAVLSPCPELVSASESGDQDKTQGKTENSQQISESIDKLTELIIKPFDSEFEQLIKGSKPEQQPQLVIIPQGKTFNIPFATLCYRGKPLCNYFTIIEAFSFNSFSFSTVQSEKPSKEDDCSDALIVGNPTNDLVLAGEEAKIIAETLGVTSLIGQLATRQQVIDRLPYAPFIHIACHGQVHGKYLFLAKDHNTRGSETHLTIKDVEKLKIRAKMVVLSGCHTARGKISSEGVLGLARAFLVAGARCVVTALWAIPDGPTKHFMTKFYKHLGEGFPVADALRMAMVHMQKTEYADVINWGAFKVYGANSSVPIPKSTV